MTKNPVAAYTTLIECRKIAPDPAQARAVQVLQRLHDELVCWTPGKKAGWPGFLNFGKALSPPEGIYFHGGVGRGKSMLMDLFFEGAPLTHRRRIHFLEFMEETHDMIFRWRQREKAGKVRGSDPVLSVAHQIAKKTHLLCFDEFQVSDIADASILGRLFTALFDLGVVVVATSNQAPEKLYEGGLNRHRFVPFIDLLKERMHVVALDGEQDYRLNRMTGLKVYHTPLDGTARRAMDQGFDKLTEGRARPRVLEIRGRALEVPQAFHRTARFSFDDLCVRPLGGADYLKIAETFDTVFIDAIPALGPEKRNEARRLVTLVDALYERKVRLVASAEAKPEGLYPQGDGSFEFGRTVSRLMEMQSREYPDS